MTLSVADCLAAITAHTLGLAAAAEGNLERRVEHCPDWSMADLVWHLTSVHWFWNRIATDLPTSEPGDLERPARPADEELIAALLAGVEVLTGTLRVADQQAPCWTWGQEENVWFITRHQVQEAAVHHWDALNAIGRAGDWSMDDVVAMDAVEEFLTHSVANPRWTMPAAEPLGGTLWFCACTGESDTAETWRVRDGDVPGTLSHRTIPLGEDAPDVDGPAVGGHGSAANFLLWLYRRLPSPFLGDRWIGDQQIVERFRAFSFTD